MDLAGDATLGWLLGEKLQCFESSGPNAGIKAARRFLRPARATKAGNVITRVRTYLQIQAVGET